MFDELYDMTSTNNCWGWLCYFAAYLYRSCGIPAAEVEQAVLLESDKAKFKMGFQSDNQCIMAGNNWFYRFHRLDETWECDADPGVKMGPEIFQKYFEYWVDRV